MLKRSINSSFSAASFSAELFGLAFAAYLIANLLLRWLNWVIFDAHGAFGFAESGPASLALIALAACVPALCAGVLCIGIARLPRMPRLGAVVALLAAWALVLLIELDLAWYAMSRQHIRWHDVTMFVTESWRDYFGIRNTDMRNFGIKAAGHFVVLAALWAAAWFKPLSQRVPRLHLARWALVVLALFAVKKTTVVFAQSAGGNHYAAVARNNPLYLEFGDQYLEQTFLNHRPDVGAVNRALAVLTPATPAASHTEPAEPANKFDVLFVAIEGWNAYLPTPDVMPKLHAHTQSCRWAKNHYATGNVTSYGVIGLLAGDPVTFVRSFDQFSQPGGQSIYIDLFNRWGYRSARLGGNLSADRKLAEFLSNFSEPPSDAKDDWLNLPVALDKLKRPGPDFVYVHYWNTHYPYLHSAQHTRYTPETPDDFNYGRSGLAEHRVAIINRYKNTLVELDAWIDQLLTQVDRQRTVIVITGDHGEEFFETGRLGHAASLDDPQVRTPFVACAPQTPSIQKQLTSHADVMPSVLQLLGTTHRSTIGRSMFVADDEPLAIVAMNNHRKPAVRWRVVTPALSAEFKVDAADDTVRMQSYQRTELPPTSVPAEPHDALVQMGQRLKNLLAQSDRTAR